MANDLFGIDMTIIVVIRYYYNTFASFFVVVDTSFPKYKLGLIPVLIYDFSIHGRDVMRKQWDLIWSPWKYEKPGIWAQCYSNLGNRRA